MKKFDLFAEASEQVQAFEELIRRMDKQQTSMKTDRREEKMEANVSREQIQNLSVEELSRDLFGEALYGEIMSTLGKGNENHSDT